jgi:hypothetical protein
MNTDKKTIPFKEYIFLFKSGGWNTITAQTKRGAISAAKKKYLTDDNCRVNENSFVLRAGNDDYYKSLLSLFY